MPESFEIRQTEAFSAWLHGLTDGRARARIAARIERMRSGNCGDVKSVGEGVSEMRIDYGPGYRVYCVRRGLQLIVLLCGGDKTTQEKDIAIAKAMAKELKSEAS